VRQEVWIFLVTRYKKATHAIEATLTRYKVFDKKATHATEATPCRLPRDTLPYTSTPRVTMLIVPLSSGDIVMVRAGRKGVFAPPIYIYSADGEISEESLRDSFFGMNLLEFMGLSATGDDHLPPRRRPGRRQAATNMHQDKGWG
jgi:hypothetical protein